MHARKATEAMHKLRERQCGAKDLRGLCPLASLSEDGGIGEGPGTTPMDSDFIQRSLGVQTRDICFVTFAKFFFATFPGPSLDLP